jgi:hypothetical protein
MNEELEAAVDELDLDQFVPGQKRDAPAAAFAFEHYHAGHRYTVRLDGLGNTAIVECACGESYPGPAPATPGELAWLPFPVAELAGLAEVLRDWANLVDCEYRGGPDEPHAIDDLPPGIRAWLDKETP